MCNFKTLASLWSWAGRFESYLVANPEDKFSHDVAQVDLDVRAWLFALQNFRIVESENIHLP